MMEQGVLGSSEEADDIDGHAARALVETLILGVD